MAPPPAAGARRGRAGRARVGLLLPRDDPRCAALPNDDAGKVPLAVDRTLGLAGLPAGKVLGFRLVGDGRFDLGLPAGTTTLSPESEPFLAKAGREAATLAGISCGNNQTLLNAADPGGRGRDGRRDAGRRGRHRGRRGAHCCCSAPIRCCSKAGCACGQRRAAAAGGRLQRRRGGAEAGSMVLCIGGRAATLGHAEFELPVDAAVIAQFRSLQAGAEPAAAFDFYGSEQRRPAGRGDRARPARPRRHARARADRLRSGDPDMVVGPVRSGRRAVRLPAGRAVGQRARPRLGTLRRCRGRPSSRASGPRTAPAS